VHKSVTSPEQEPVTHNWKTLVRARIGGVPVDALREADIVDELAQHVADHYVELVAAGVPEAEALGKVLAPLADRARVVEEITRADRPQHVVARLKPSRLLSLVIRASFGEARRRAFGAKAARYGPAPPPSNGSSASLLNLARDVRYAVRLLVRAPGFVAAAIITLALGIGANAAIFGVVRAVVLKPPPYRDASRVVAFLNSNTGAPGWIASSSLPDYEDWQRQLTSFDGTGLLSGWTFNLTGLELPERVYGARVSFDIATIALQASGVRSAEAFALRRRKCGGRDR
jgi:hypothetical protein